MASPRTQSALTALLATRQHAANLSDLLQSCEGTEEIRAVRPAVNALRDAYLSVLIAREAEYNAAVAQDERDGI